MRRQKGAAFVFGWLVSLAIVITATVLATGNNPQAEHRALTGIAEDEDRSGRGLVVIAIRDRRQMRRPKKPKEPPKWQAYEGTRPGRWA